MRIKAYVTDITGNTKHFKGAAHDEEVNELNRIPTPKWVEISEESKGFFLFHFDSKGECIADTWHETLEDAKEQAKFEFDIAEKDWQPVKPGAPGN